MHRGVVFGSVTKALQVLVFGMVLAICGPVQAGDDPNLDRDTESFQEAGQEWGERLLKNKITPESNLDNKTSKEFIYQLIDSQEIAYFEVHSDLKEAFKKGFRQGYQDRTADLVLGPHLQKAAGLIGERTAQEFVDTVEAFEKGWKRNLDQAVRVFITLIAEGSQADRREFVDNFVEIYGEKYQANQKIIKAGFAMAVRSDGGTLIFLDPTKVQNTLDIPSDNNLRVEIYKQTYRVMGDEMGRRFSHNLIPRTELVDWLRRSRSALNMDQDKIDSKLIAQSLAMIEEAFQKSYGTDGPRVFKELAKEAGY